jgi:tetratricopeptide (TPR) repeat protein
MALQQRVLVLFFWVAGFCVLAQTDFEKALALEHAFKDHEALAVYEQILKTNPNDVDALARASRMLSNMGGRLEKNQKTQKEPLVNKARDYAERAVAINPNHLNAHLSLAVSLGLQSEISSNASEKVKNAKLIYTEGKTLLRLDSNLAVGYFILGKWHLELGQLNWMERAACDLFFGGMPEDVSMEQALIYVQRASRLEPNTILFLYNEALVQQQLDNDKKAIELLRYSLTLANREPDDDIRKEKCRALLRELED